MPKIQISYCRINAIMITALATIVSVVILEFKLSWFGKLRQSLALYFCGTKSILKHWLAMYIKFNHYFMNKRPH